MSFRIVRDLLTEYGPAFHQMVFGHVCPGVLRPSPFVAAPGVAPGTALIFERGGWASAAKSARCDQRLWPVRAGGSNPSRAPRCARLGVSQAAHRNCRDGRAPGEGGRSSPARCGGHARDVSREGKKAQLGATGKPKMIPPRPVKDEAGHDIVRQESASDADDRGQRARFWQDFSMATIVCG